MRVRGLAPPLTEQADTSSRRTASGSDASPDVISSPAVQSTDARRPENQLSEALTAGRSGIHRIERFPTEGLRTTIAATVDFLFDRPFAAPELSEKLAKAAIKCLVATPGKPFKI